MIGTANIEGAQGTRITRTLNLLVVDDNLGNAQMMADVFKSAGHLVRMAAGGFEAIRAAVAERPDGILMDVRMPDLDGYQAARRIKTLLPDVKIVGISGSPITAQTAGDVVIFDEQLAKPIRPEELLAALDRLFA